MEKNGLEIIRQNALGKNLKCDLNTDDNLEAFGEKYNYEPDEQSNETQDKSIREIKKRTPREWIEELFGVRVYT